MLENLATTGDLRINLVALEVSSFKCGHDAPMYSVIEGIDYFLRRYRDEVIRKRKAAAEIVFRYS